MEATTSWLVRTDEERRLLRDMEEAITPARKLSIVVIAVSLVLFIDGHGWWFVPVVLSYVAFAQFCERKRQRDDRATDWMFALTMVTQATFALCAVGSGGPASPALLWLVVAMVPMSARYGERGAIVGSAFTLLCLVAASLSQGIGAFMDRPDLFAATLSSGISCFGYGIAMRKSEARQRQAAVVDPLTGLLNRSRLADRFEEVRQISAVRGESIALLVCDLDRFKAINDRHGHAGGDAVLVGTADELRRVLEGHLLYRLGGEEFVAVFPGLGVQGAAAKADLVRAAIAAARPGGVAVTISIGVAAAAADGLTYEALFARADGALYDAKRRGRNRVVAVELIDDEARESGLGRGVIDPSAVRAA